MINIYCTSKAYLQIYCECSLSWKHEKHVYYADRRRFRRIYRTESLAYIIFNGEEGFQYLYIKMVKGR